jgi:hypothetical protein
LATYQTSVTNNTNQSTYNISPLWYGWAWVFNIWFYSWYMKYK